MRGIMQDDPGRFLVCADNLGPDPNVFRYTFKDRGEAMEMGTASSLTVINIRFLEFKALRNINK